MQFVLDASALIAYLRDEPGGEAVEACLSVEPPACLAHAVNLCEVFYTFLRRSGEEEARRALDDLQAVGVRVREDLDEAFWQQAGRYKVQYAIPLPDAIAVALADRFGAEVVTSDRGDFEKIAHSGVCGVKFIR